MPTGDWIGPFEVSKAGKIAVGRVKVGSVLDRKRGKSRVHNERTNGLAVVWRRRASSMKRSFDLLEQLADIVER